MPEDDDIIDPRSLPIHKKGEEIYELVRAITDLIDDYDDAVLKEIKGFMLLDASWLTVKVARAEAGDLYDLRMEAASIIRKAARDLVLHVHTLEMHGFKEAHYYDLIRKAVDEYRLLFIDWVASFDKWNYSIDRWGLFNPPGLVQTIKIQTMTFLLIRQLFEIDLIVKTPITAFIDTPQKILVPSLVPHKKS